MEGDSMSVTSINNQLNTNYEYLSTVMRINSATDALVYLSSYDIISGFDIPKIDDVIKMVSSFRGTNGISSNNLDYVYSDSQYMCQNLMDAKNPVQDLDVPSNVLDMSKNQIMNDNRMFVQSAKTGQATRGISILFRGSSLMDGIYRKDILKS